MVINYENFFKINCSKTYLFYIDKLVVLGWYASSGGVHHVVIYVRRKYQLY